ncbi:MAG: hypothetical protein ACKO1Y_02720 [Actinomycetota bacterium]
MTDRLPPKPNFVIIGAQKSATRWLRVNLGRHPEMFTVARELHYWNGGDAAGALRPITWYRKQFAGWSGEPFLGEATPGYMIWRHTPARTALRMRIGIPNARLIALLRNPIDRAQSALNHHARRFRIPPGARLVDVLRERQPLTLDRLCLATGGWYASSLHPFRQGFGDQLLVVLHDDVVAEPVRVYETAVAHIGAGSGFVPDTIGRVVFSGSPSGGPTRSGLSVEDRVAVWPYFREEVVRLEEFLDRDLSQWDPTRSGTGSEAVSAASTPELQPEAVPVPGA